MEVQTDIHMDVWTDKSQLYYHKQICAISCYDHGAQITPNLPYFWFKKKMGGGTFMFFLIVAPGGGYNSAMQT